MRFWVWHETFHLLGLQHSAASKLWGRELGAAELRELNEVLPLDKWWCWIMFREYGWWNSYVFLHWLNSNEHCSINVTLQNHFSNVDIHKGETTRKGDGFVLRCNKLCLSVTPRRDQKCNFQVKKNILLNYRLKYSHLGVGRGGL